MRDWPEQVSGFKLSTTTSPLSASLTSDLNGPKEGEEGGAEEEGDDLIPKIYETFLEALQSKYGDEKWLEETLIEAGIGSTLDGDAKGEFEKEEARETETGVEMDGAGFSFGFFDEGDDGEGEEVFDV